MIKILHRKTLLNLGKHLGNGSEGDVYRIGKFKVIKVVYDDYDIQEIKSHIVKLSKIKSKYLPKIYEFGTFGRHKKPAGYYYIMEYVPYSVSFKEDLIICSIKSNDETNFHSLFEVKNNKIKKLFEWITKSNLYVYDLHAGNFRKDRQGNIKIIDFEGVFFVDKERKRTRNGTYKTFE